MIEILVLIFLTRKIGNIAVRKGLPPGRWKLYTVLAWFGAEILGMFLGYALFGPQNIVALLLFALFCAGGGYLLIQAMLQKIPDQADRDPNDLL